MDSSACSGPSTAALPAPQDALALTSQARALGAMPAQEAAPLRGRQLALLSTDCGDATAHDFVQAATALGARVSLLTPRLDEQGSPERIDAMARMLGQLYDAVECQHLPDNVVQRLARHAGIPVFAGLATADHPTAPLAGRLGEELPWATRRRHILQAALILSMP